MIKQKSVFSFILFFILGFVSIVTAQDQNYSGDDILSKIQRNEKNEGEVMIFQDMRVNNLLYNHVEQNKRRGVSGYRIRIYANLGNEARDQSQATRTRFYELFPEIPIYREYVSPYFRVLVGDYRSRIDAMKDFNRIKKYFPTAFIVPDEINYPEMEE